jgi:PGF-pre-PGF domain-containing protein
MTYDPSEDLVYFVGETASATSGIFGVYNRTSSITENLNGTDTGDWIGVNRLKRVKYNPIDGLIYLAGNSGIFGAYNRSSNTTTIVEQQEEEEISEGGGTHPPTSPPTTTAETIPTASPGSPAVVNVNNSNMGLTQITVNVSQTVSNVSITITKLNSTQGAELRISLRRNGALYEAYDINATLSNQNISNVEINFKVNKTWLVNQNTTVNNVRLYRYVNNRWTRLTTTLMGQDSQFYYFSAISPGFSTFVVFFGEFECDPGETRCFENQAQLCLGNATWLITEKCFGGCENGECLETPFKFDLKTLYFVAGIIVVGLIVIFLLRRVPKGKNKSSKEVRSSFYHKQSLHKSR